ncbi:hypothetical protein T439DRAFT_323698 [Meredithblackwellia eburnea MCA 4105]
MTRSHQHKKEISRHMKPAAYLPKKSGHGSANWGSFDDEISEGIAIVASGGRAKGDATAADLGMSKLSTSSSSTSSSFSAKSDEEDSSSSASIVSSDA